MSCDSCLIGPGRAFSLGSRHTLIVLGYVMPLAVEQTLRIRQLLRISNNPVHSTMIQTTISMVS